MRWPLARRVDVPPPLIISLARGDLAQWDADAIAVSANPHLEGVARSGHWRFAGRQSADGAVRAVGGRSLAAAAARIQARSGPLATGTAVASSAGRSLSARWVVHCIAPDALARSPDEHAAFMLDPAEYERHLADTLQATFTAAIATASTLGARSLAMPAIGCGVRGFAPEVAGTAAFRAASEWLRSSSSSSSSRSSSSLSSARLRRLDFVIRSDSVWASWPECGRHALGPPDEAGSGDGDGRGLMQWTQASS